VKYIYRHAYKQSDALCQPYTRYTRLLDEYEASISRNVTGNLLTRHILPLWGK
jgi:hypothetical protein